MSQMFSFLFSYYLLFVLINNVVTRSVVSVLGISLVCMLVAIKALHALLSGLLEENKRKQETEDRDNGKEYFGSTLYLVLVLLSL